MPENIKIETPRLTVTALLPHRFRLLLDDQRGYERLEGLTPTPTQFDAETREAMEWLYGELIKQEGRSYPWFTNWQIILRDEGRVIGSLCFKGPPDIVGVVEVGYGIDPEHRGRGYMKEALSGVCEWALAQEGVTAVIAGTDPDNTASGRVLESCGMERVDNPGESGDWWRLESK